MGNNKKNTNTDGVCEKIYKAIRHISPSPENPKLHQKPPRSQAISSEVPVLNNTQVSAPPLKEKVNRTKTNGQVSKVSSKVEREKTKVPTKPKTKEKLMENHNAGGTNDFSNYISRAKAKIRATSSIGGGRGRESVTRLDSLDVKVGDYIKRTKMKIRTVTGIGGGKNLSIK